jgi:hypothetical protein
LIQVMQDQNIWAVGIFVGGGVRRCCINPHDGEPSP